MTHPTESQEISENTAPRVKEATSAQRVYEAVRELRGLGLEATRHTVSEMTGLKMTIVDDRLRYLVEDDQRLRRTVRGCYELTEQYPPPRPMSITILTDGCVKTEIGNDVHTLTPAEARAFARALGGFLDDARMLEASRAQLMVATELAENVERLRRANLPSKVQKLQRQLQACQTTLRALHSHSVKNNAQMELMGLTGPEDVVPRACLSQANPA